MLLEINVGELISPYLEITKSDGTITTTSELVINNGIISYLLPFSVSTTFTL